METVLPNGTEGALESGIRDQVHDDDEVEIIEERICSTPPSKRHKSNNADGAVEDSSAIAKQLNLDQSTTISADSVHQNSTTLLEQSTTVPSLSDTTKDQSCSITKESSSLSDSRKRWPTEFLFGPYVPIIRTEHTIVVDTLGIQEDYHRFTSRDPVRKRLVGEILPDDSIVEVPSLVTPLLLKKHTVWPPVYKTSEDKSDSNDVEVIKIVKRDNQQDIVTRDENRYRSREDYIKDAVINSLTNNSSSSKKDSQYETILAIDDYGRSSAGQLLYGIGFSFVNQFIMEEQFRRLTHRMRKGDSGLITEYDTLKKNLAKTKSSNRRLKPNEILECHKCPFKTESASVLDYHLETPHKNTSRFFLCNWCGYKTKDSSQIINHNLLIHRKYRCRNEKQVLVHCCRYCQFETSSKRKYTSHVSKCERLYQPEYNQAPELDDYPAITSKYITQSDIRTYESVLKGLRLAAYNPHQIKVSSTARGLDGLPILLVPKSSPAANILNLAMKQKKDLSFSEAINPYINPNAIIGRGLAHDDRSDASQDRVVAPNLLRLLAVNSTMNNLPDRRATMLQHPRPQSMFVNGMSIARCPQNIVMPPPNRVTTMTSADPVNSQASKTLSDEDKSRSNSISNNNVEGTFVICEICDAYIDNITFFKSHMQWVHKVKIHTKVLETLKPPLNCQKCNWRYFTDQGLERHLLGSHGLVTPNMQELADKEKDSGRCTICGVRCASKLVSHIKDIHKITLKPAQLSYKCTVCGATFCMYRLFENHVYRVHGCS